MAPKANANAATRKPMQNGNSNKEAVVSSTSGSPSNGRDGAVVKKGKTVTKLQEKNISSGRGRGRKKATTTEFEEGHLDVEENGTTKTAAKGRGKNLAADVVNKATAEKSPVKLEVDKTNAKKGRKNVASKKATKADEAPGASSTYQETTQTANGDTKGSESGEKSPVEKTNSKKGRKNMVSKKETNEVETPMASSSNQETTRGAAKKGRKVASVDENTDVKKESKGRKNAVPHELPSTKANSVKQSGSTQPAKEETPEEPKKKGRKLKKVAVKRKAEKDMGATTSRKVEHKTADSVEEDQNIDKKEVQLQNDVEKEKKPRGRKRVLAAEDNAIENVVAKDVEKEKKPRGRKRALAAEDTATDKDDGAKPTKTKKPAATTAQKVTNTIQKAEFALEPATRYNLKISSWNVAGLRSWLKKDGLRFLEYEEPDIFCLQEIKCTIDQLPAEVARIPGYHPYWLCMPGGYAGVAIYSKIMPIHVEYGIGNDSFDDVGRMITAEYEKFFLINVYVPNSGRKLVNLEPRMRWEKLFQAYVKRLDALKPVVICGDMNVSHQEIDLANPKTNTRSAGFTQEERDKMTELLSLGFVDTFRHLYPDRKGAYTFWTYMGNARSRNVGWRLDYFIASERFTNRVVENCMRPQIMGSDHCPITLFLKL